MGQIFSALLPLLINLLGMMSLTAGTLYQKSIRYNADLQSIASVQYIAAFCATLPFAYMLEPMHVNWSLSAILTLLWSICGLSIGAILLFLYLLRRNEAVRATQLFFLMPPTSAIQAYLFFGESFTIGQLIGMILTILGVAFAQQN